MSSKYFFLLVTGILGFHAVSASEGPVSNYLYGCGGNSNVPACYVLAPSASGCSKFGLSATVVTWVSTASKANLENAYPSLVAAKQPMPKACTKAIAEAWLAKSATES